MHLNEEQLVLHHYHDDDLPSAVEEHLASCSDCRGEYEKLRSVLRLVDELPAPDRGPQYGEQVWNRLRWRLERRRRTWVSALAAAAMLAIAFFAGQFWRTRSAPQPASGHPLAVARGEASDRVLVVVVGDHLDNSERMLLDVVNADAKHELDLPKESQRASELLASNRIYRQTAAQRGDARIASLLADLEPILVELSHAETLTPDDLASLQKRIESKGLLFKVRVVSAETSGREAPPRPQKGINSL